MAIKIEASKRLQANADYDKAVHFVKYLGLVPKEHQPPLQSTASIFQIGVEGAGGISGFMLAAAKITGVLGVHPNMRNHAGYPIAKWDLGAKGTVEFGTNQIGTYVTLTNCL